MRETPEGPHAAVSGPLCFDFTGRRVLLTGATRGIAEAIARALGAAGATLLLHYSADADAASGHPDAARELSAELSVAGIEVHLLEGDLAERGAGARLGRLALEHGEVDSMVLSASRQIHKPLLAQSTADIDHQLSINLHANIELLQVLLPGMVANGFGRVLTIGSIQEVAPSADTPIYAMCKSALRNLMENITLQVGGHGITVNNIAPGLIETDRNAFRRQDSSVWARISAQSSAMGRAGVPGDIVGPALMCLARETSYVTGQTIYVSGGGHMARLTGDGSYPRIEVL